MLIPLVVLYTIPAIGMIACCAIEGEGWKSSLLAGLFWPVVLAYMLRG